MQIWLTHWHCIVPLAAIAIGALLMREKPTDSKAKHPNNTPAAPRIPQGKQHGGK